jgi:hypothetical protein
MLLTMIMFLSNDFVDGLTGPDAIQGQQLRFSHLMYKYLKSRYGAASAAREMGETVMIVAYSRELGEIESRRLKI